MCEDNELNLDTPNFVARIIPISIFLSVWLFITIDIINKYGFFEYFTISKFYGIELIILLIINFSLLFTIYRYSFCFYKKLKKSKKDTNPKVSTSFNYQSSYVRNDVKQETFNNKKQNEENQNNMSAEEIEKLMEGLDADSETDFIQNEDSKNEMSAEEIEKLMEGLDADFIQEVIEKDNLNANNIDDFKSTERETIKNLILEHNAKNSLKFFLDSYLDCFEKKDVTSIKKILFKDENYDIKDSVLRDDYETFNLLVKINLIENS